MPDLEWKIPGLEDAQEEAQAQTYTDTGKPKPKSVTGPMMRL